MLQGPGNGAIPCNLVSLVNYNLLYYQFSRCRIIESAFLLVRKVYVHTQNNVEILLELYHPIALSLPARYSPVGNKGSWPKHHSSFCSLKYQRKF